MTPAPGERLLRFVGDKILFTLRIGNNFPAQKNWSARLRTNLGRAATRRHEIICAHAGGTATAGASWRDVPMKPTADGWAIELPLAEVGYFKAKAYLLDEKEWQHWPEGPDLTLSVHPNFARTANTIYCAFTRLFGATKNLATTADPVLEANLLSLEARGYATLPPSGKFRDLERQLPHIIHTLGCRIIHLLPVHPTPVTYARFGRFGSPYAALDLTAVDPALVEFDKRATGIEQFCELTFAAHSLGARIFIDIVINHTGWGSTLQENHPEFFLRKSDGEFASPGAWGTVWEDLAELEQNDVVLWDIIADSLITWCRRGVDGFRCDAGYKIPPPAWEYIIARVQDEFPETIFLLEGLGGSWDTTELLLTEGGMQWAYSELFQNYSGRDIAGYLDYVNRQDQRVGGYFHYSETHDNSRLAEKGRAWSLLRNRLCALTSPSGGFGFTCGVEWLATEKIRVHGNTGLNWDSADNIVPELARLNWLLSEHPCFFDGAKLTRLSAPDSPIYALLRESAEGRDSVLVLVNTELEKENVVTLSRPAISEKSPLVDLLGQKSPEMSVADAKTVFKLPPGAAYCLASTEQPAGLSGSDYRVARGQAAWAFEAFSKVMPAEKVDGLYWRWLAEQVSRSPQNVLAAASEFAKPEITSTLPDILAKAEQQNLLPRVIVWTLIDSRRVTLVPPGYWLLIEESTPFRVMLEITSTGSVTPQHVHSIAVGNRHIASFPPRELPAEAKLTLQRYATTSPKVTSAIRFLSSAPEAEPAAPSVQPSDLVLLTNGIGGMARLCADFGRVNSKYDCVLGANLNPEVPVDRHIFVKRLRLWVNADGFLTPLDRRCLVAFETGPAAAWHFVANAGNGCTVEIEVRAEMVPGKNTTVFQFNRPVSKKSGSPQLPGEADVRVTVRVDIEDRNFHSETKRNDGADYHFSRSIHPLEEKTGFLFAPAPDRQLRVFTDAGDYHSEPEWCENIPHPVEQTRGQVGAGDAYSPGWFELPLHKGESVTFTATAEAGPTGDTRKIKTRKPDRSFDAQLLHAAQAYVVRRNNGKTVIAGYPWFLDWGRDSLICARGLIAAGLLDDVQQLLLTFAKFEQNGTLPNTIHGDDVSNRDTSDAPLWFAVVCEEFSNATSSKKQNFFGTVVDQAGRTILDVLTSIAENYARGTPNGIHMDSDSALIWSPSHFTWMDTNFPAGTPREGYPVEIQVLWIRLLRLLARLSDSDGQKKWNDLADHATLSFEKLFWLEDRGWFADVLIGGTRVIARDATPSDALRSNCLFAVSLGLVTGDRARRCVAAAQKYLVVPGGLRSLAPLPVKVPLPVARDGQLLNNPTEPYWPRYEGDEDTRRKPAYHNGTAWTWTFPTFCEALAIAWDQSPEVAAAARSYLGSSEKILNEGCLGQIPELLDGDLPHTQRGCDAQAWGVTEALRVWRLLEKTLSS